MGDPPFYVIQDEVTSDRSIKTASGMKEIDNEVADKLLNLLSTRIR